MSSLASVSPHYTSPPSALHAILLAGVIPLFLGALLSDIAYFKTYQIQWANFASWLIAGGLLFCGLALLFALGGLIIAKRKVGALIYFLMLLLTWTVGLVNAFEHAKDALAAMPSGLIMSVIMMLLACITTWVRFASPFLGARNETI